MDPREKKKFTLSRAKSIYDKAKKDLSAESAPWPQEMPAARQLILGTKNKSTTLIWDLGTRRRVELGVLQCEELNAANLRTH